MVLEGPLLTKCLSTGVALVLFNSKVHSVHVLLEGSLLGEFLPTNAALVLSHGQMDRFDVKAKGNFLTEGLTAGLALMPANPVVDSVNMEFQCCLLKEALVTSVALEWPLVKMDSFGVDFEVRALGKGLPLERPLGAEDLSAEFTTIFVSKTHLHSGWKLVVMPMLSFPQLAGIARSKPHTADHAVKTASIQPKNQLILSKVRRRAFLLHIHRHSLFRLDFIL